jgi:Tol biopolymer transport system component
MRLLGAVLAATLGVCGFTLVPARATTEALIAVLPQRGGVGEYHLWLVEPVRPGRPRQLTSGVVRDAHPAVSPEGRWLAFTRTTADDPVNAHLWLLDLSTGAERQMTRGASDAYPFWSPDGRRLGFTRGGLGPANDTAMLYAMDPFVAQPRPEPLLPRGPGKQMQGSWHPTGRYVLFDTPGYGLNPYTIWRASVGGSDAQEVIASGCCGVQMGRYSPNGRRIAYATENHGPSGDIYVANADGTGQTRVTCESGWSSPAWSPAGDALAMINNKTAGVWRVAVPKAGGPCVRPTVRIASLPVGAFTWARVAR